MRKQIMIIGLLVALFAEAAPVVTKMMPANGAVDVNPDTHLTLTLSEEVGIGDKGFISVYDKQTDKLIDRLEMSIPAGPTKGQPANPLAQYTPVPYLYQSEHITNRTTTPGTPSGANAWDTGRYQLDIIGGFSDGFHFYPVIVHGQQATIYLHHNMLEYGHEYYVTIDKGVLEGFDGIKGKKGWTFRTKTAPPSPEQRRLIVAADGSGDFSTVQGAMDFIPDFLTSESDRYTMFVKNGDYEELVYFRNKRFVTIEGESREGVLVHYPNNEVFNPHPADIKTNEMKGTFPSRRAAFAADNSTDLIFRNITLKTDCKGQAEGLLVNGERNFFENVHIIGDGDALQANGSCYWLNCRIDGGGDTILGRGPSFFNHCTITSYGAFMWIRNTAENHGNVFIDCCFKGLSDFAELGRLPDNKGKNYPHAECVLINCELENIPASGWGQVDEGATTATLLEFNSHDSKGHPIDTSQRHPLLRQLDPLRDAELIGRYSDSHWVLGWYPAQAQVSFGRAELFNGGWLFSLSDDGKASEPTYDDCGWRRLDVPHDWSIEGQLSQDYASCTGYLPAGIGWYRKHFTLKASQQKTYIYFEGIYNRSEVWLNGHLLGKRPNGYVSFLYDMTPYIQEGENILAVRVDHSRIADSRWYTGSGIYRDVWLVQAPEVHLSQWGATYRLKKLEHGEAIIEVDVAVDAPRQVQDAYEVRVSVSDQGTLMTSSTIALESLKEGQSRKTVEMRIPQVRLWNLKDPYLYQLKVELLKQQKTVDQTEIAMGLRTLQFDPDKGFALNGEWMKVKGVCLHHDAGVLGAVVPREVWVRKIRELKRMGANAIRMSHNPQAPVLYDICDQEGMLVMDEASDEWEFPKRKWIEGWNQGEPGYDGSFDFFEEWIDRDVADMVRRDRNHPCVFLWSVGNEVDYPNDPYSHPILDGNNASISQPMFGGYKPEAPHAERIGKIAKRLAAVIRSIDTSRPVTGALAGVVMSNETDYPEAIDVVGYNYTEKRYDEDHLSYPKRIIYGSETGVGYDSWKAVRDKQHIFGQFIWTGTDYLGESGRWPSRGLNTGLLDFGSFRKPRGWFRAALWSDEPVTYIGTYPLLPPRGDQPRRRQWDPSKFISPEAQDDWDLPASIAQDSGVMMRVVCYTNAPQARLLLNDKVVGAMKAQNDSNAIIYWDIPFEPGTLRAEGCDEKGRVLSSYEIATSTEPAALRASELLPEDCETLHQILVEVVDTAGNRVKSALNDVTCTIEGPATLLGLEGGNNRDMSDYHDNHQPVYRGRLVCYVRRTAPGPVKITFSAAGLQSCICKLI